MNDLPARPPLSLIINGVEYKMTYGLEMDLRRLLPDAGSTVTLLQTDPSTQDYVVRRVLTPLKKMVTDEAELVKPDDLDITSEDIQLILDWVMEHNLYFFVKRAKMVQQLGEKYREVLPNRSTTGSQD